MMGKRRSLGLALGERRIVAAEVRSARGRHEVVRVAELAFPEGVTWDDPVAVGGCLGRFLREQRLPRAGTIGIPARWLMTVTREVPPAGPRVLAGILRMEAERAFSLDSGQMVCDWAAAPAEGKAGKALLVATTSGRLSAVVDAARAARFKARAVTSTAAALALAGTADSDGLTALITSDGIEIAFRRNGRLTDIRHAPLAGSGTASDAVAAALRLAIGSRLASGQDGVGRVALWDGVGLSGSAREACAGLGVELDVAPELPLAGLPEAASGAGIPDGRAASAAALAAAGLEPGLAPFDLLHSRLAVRPARHWARWTAWAGFLLLAFAVGGGALVMDRKERKREIAAMQARLDEMAPSIAEAERVVESVNQARGWYDRRPPFLDCLVALTRAFPERGDIWATSLAVRDDMRGVLAGKATDEQAVLGVLDALQQSGAFAEVKLLYIQETRGAGGESSFDISFAHVAAE